MDVFGKDCGEGGDISISGVARIFPVGALGPWFFMGAQVLFVHLVHDVW